MTSSSAAASVTESGQVLPTTISANLIQTIIVENVALRVQFTSLIVSVADGGQKFIIITMVIRPLDDRTQCARSAFTSSGLRETCTNVYYITSQSDVFSNVPN